MLRHHSVYTPSYQFSTADVERIFRIAPMFDVNVRASDEEVSIQVQDGSQQRSITLPRRVAHLRVLTEVCEKTIRWVYYHDGEHCARSLLSLTDARLERLAELYRLKGREFPTAAEELAEPATPMAR